MGYTVICDREAQTCSLSSPKESARYTGRFAVPGSSTAKQDQALPSLPLKGMAPPDLEGFTPSLVLQPISLGSSQLLQHQRVCLPLQQPPLLR